MSWEDIKWVLGDIVIPTVIFILGFVAGYGVCRYKSKAKIKGDRNTIVQNSNDVEIKKA